MDVFVARQPIFTRKRKLTAYELLFRTGTENIFPDFDGDTATSNLLSSSFFSSGIDRISGGNKSFINFTEELLVRRIAEMFPPDQIMIEILENVEPTPEVITACRNLKSKGYTIALDDFEDVKKHEELLELADVVKIDFIQTPQDQIVEMVHELNQFKCKLLAEKIENYQEFKSAMSMGFEYFQGYFFSKPEILRNKDIPPGKIASLKLIQEINGKRFNIDVIEDMINKDVALSYKLLKYLNSAYFSRLSPLKSIRQAIAYLGERGTRLFVSLIATSQLAQNKPGELIRFSMIRAKFLERFSERCGEDKEELFLLGLFSLIDAMLDNPMSYLVEQLPLNDDLKAALATRSGRLAPFLNLVEAYENGQWVSVERIMKSYGVEIGFYRECYMDAITFADSY